MQILKVDELIPHPKNDYFFDDMEGEKWKEFLESIKTSGVIEPIIITQDKVIVSGHQRIRACKELGIKDVNTEMRYYDNDDQIVKDLLETNVRQRGNIGGSSVKLGRRIRELERIYGIKNGNNQYEGMNNVQTLSQEELAQQLGISVRTLQNAKSLTTLPQEIQDLIEQGNISPSTASRLIAKLSPEEQEQLVSALPATEKLTQKQVQSYIDKLSANEVVMEGYKREADKALELKKRIAELEAEIKKATTPQVKTITKEVTPSDYGSLKSDNVSLRQDNARMAQEYKEKCQELFELKDKLKAIEEDSSREKIEDEMQRDCIFFCARCDDFIKKVGGYAYLSDKINSLPETEKKSYIKCVQMIGAWANNILFYIDNEN